MSIIDFHTHIFPDDVASRVVPQMETEGGVAAVFDGTISGLIANMDRSGVDISVIHPVATRPDQVCSINDWTASLASDRIVPFGAMHPDFDGVAEEMARIRGLGMCGIKMHPEYQSCRPDDERMKPIYKAAIVNGLAILFHAGRDLAMDTLHAEPADFARVMQDYTDLHLILAHMGGFQLWEQVREHLIGLPLWIDTSYSLGHMQDDEFEDMVRSHGSDRVLFGSDGPWADSGKELEMLRDLSFTSEELMGILGGNTRELFSL